MATYTTNLNLEKPDENDNFRRQVINENMDKIDAAVAAKADSGQVQGMLADYVRQPGYAEATGSANTYLASLRPAPAEYASGMGIAVKINVTNTGASTINIDGLGAKSIRDSKGNAMTAGKLKSGSIYSLKYNGVNFILQGEGGGGTAGAGDVLSGKTFTNDAGDQTGTMVHQMGDTQALSSTVSGLTLKLLPSSGYRNGINDYITLNNPTLKTTVSEGFSINIDPLSTPNMQLDKDGNCYIFDGLDLKLINRITGGTIWSINFGSSFSKALFTLNRDTGEVFLINSDKTLRKINSTGNIVINRTINLLSYTQIYDLVYSNNRLFLLCDNASDSSSYIKVYDALGDYIATVNLYQDNYRYLMVRKNGNIICYSRSKGAMEMDAQSLVYTQVISRGIGRGYMGEDKYGNLFYIFSASSGEELISTDGIIKKWGEGQTPTCLTVDSKGNCYVVVYEVAEDGTGYKNSTYKFDSFPSTYEILLPNLNFDGEYNLYEMILNELTGDLWFYFNGSVYKKTLSFTSI